MDHESVKSMKFEVDDEDLRGVWLRLEGPEGETRAYLTKSQLRDLEHGARSAQKKLA